MTTNQQPTVSDVFLEASRQEPTRNVVFAAPPDDARARRPVDVFSLVVASLVVVLAGITHRAPSDLDRRVLDFVGEGIPGWIEFLSNLAFVLGGVYAGGLVVGVLLFASERKALFRDMVLAAALSLAIVVVGSGVTVSRWPDILPELVNQDRYPAYPVLRLTFAVAVILVASPYLSLPVRQVGRRLLVAMGVAALLLGYGTLSAVIGAVAGGVAAAAAIHLIFGSGVGIPSKPRVMDVLRTIGLEPEGVDYLPTQPVGTTLLKAQFSGGGSALVRVYGRDAADAATANRLWRTIWYRGDRQALTATGLQQVEHESLMLLEGARTGAPVQELMAWGRGTADDAVVVTDWLEAPRLEDLERDDVSSDLLRRCWQSLARLHDAGIAHREIDRHRIVLADDRVLLDDLSGATMARDDLNRAADVVQMLVTTAVAAGPDPAIAAARATIGDERLAAAIPLLQSAALPSSLQRDAKQAGIKTKDLRAAVTEATGAADGELVQLERVTWRNLVMLVLTFVAAYSLISSLAGIGFDTIADELSTASWEWVLVAFVLAQLTNIGEYVALTGMIDRDVPFGPTILFRYALSFVSLAVPSEAGAIAMNIRYMEKLGVGTASAAAQGPLLTVFSKGTDIILLVVVSRIIGQSVDLDDIDSGPALRLLILIGVVLVIGVGITLAVPKLRQQVVPPIMTAMRTIRASITSAERLTRIVGGTLLQRLVFALALSAAVSAYGESLSFGEAVFVNSAVSLFVGLMPVPGGIGVGEAALTTGLIAVGVDEGTALGAAITHRMVTSYLPPIIGWFSSRWLTERDYL